MISLPEDLPYEVVAYNSRINSLYFFKHKPDKELYRYSLNTKLTSISSYPSLRKMRDNEKGNSNIIFGNEVVIKKYLMVQELMK